MTKGITYALRHLQSLGIQHGELRTKNIYFDVDYFLFRVYDNELINGPYSLYRKSLENPSNIVYMAPELIQASTVQLLSQIDVFRADVFSFGMVLLECSTLQSIADCYDTSRKEVKWEVVQKKLALVAQYYSIYLAQFIQNLLEPDTKLRPDWNLLAHQLQDPTLFDVSSQKIIHFKLRIPEPVTTPKYQVLNDASDWKKRVWSPQ